MLSSKKVMDGIRFDRLSSIYRFYNLVSEVIGEFKHKDIECMPYNVPRAFGEHWTGRCFRMKKKGKEDFIWPVFGISYIDDPPVIYISFDKNWCDPVYKKYKCRTKKSAPFTAIHEDKEIRFELRPEKFDEFSKLPLSKQKTLLAGFLKAAADEVSSCL